MNYDYHVVDLGGMDKEDVAKTLTKFGHQGWHLKHVTHSGFAVFERQNASGDVGKDNEPAASQAQFRLVFPAGKPLAVQEPVFEGKPNVDPPMDFWNLMPVQRDGEKRLELKTAMAAGNESADHAHKAVIILDPEKEVKAGLTDFETGHVHTIKRMGRTEEADGHSHSFRMIEDGAVGVTPYDPDS